MDSNILQFAKFVTGLTEQEVTEKLEAIPCSHIDALEVFMNAGRFPSTAECDVINKYGYEIWEALYYSGNKKRHAVPPHGVSK